ncbi:hypothetical protein [Acinetobacter sp. A47]|uniref:hypothetical protein n=1 Tax=Acinetobacter sp. A47 TaxID=1561217 RepID=UPI000690340C|nr:hypothetical protein [Acinetobacter sp. A47]
MSQFLNDEHQVIEAIEQVKNCIRRVTDRRTKAAIKEAKDALYLIRKNLNLDEDSELRQKVNLLQSLLYKAG